MGMRTTTGPARHYKRAACDKDAISCRAPQTLFGVPPFLVAQFARQGIETIAMQLIGRVGVLRRAMNAANALGCAVGNSQRQEPS